MGLCPISRKLCTLFVILVLQFSMRSSAEAQEIRTIPLGNALEAIVIVIDGPFEADLPERFEDHMIGHEGFRVALNSPGGSLSAGIELGRLIRKHNLTTEISRIEVDGYGGSLTDEAVCASACAYAFMGGSERYFAPQAKLGLHQFYGQRLQRAQEATQEISGALITYLVEMGVDARVFQLASTKNQNEMYWLDPTEALEYDVITPNGFSAWRLEPYGAGVIASSERLDQPNPYDRATHGTFYCSTRDGSQNFLMTAWSLDSNLAKDGDLTASWGFQDINNEVTLRHQSKASDISGRMDGDTQWITITIPPRVAQAAAGSPRFWVSLDLSRSSGGWHFQHTKSSPMDGKIIETALKLCI